MSLNAKLVPWNFAAGFRLNWQLKGEKAIHRAVAIATTVFIVIAVFLATLFGLYVKATQDAQIAALNDKVRHLAEKIEFLQQSTIGADNHFPSEQNEEIEDLEKITEELEEENEIQLTNSSQHSLLTRQRRQTEPKRKNKNKSNQCLVSMFRGNAPQLYPNTGFLNAWTEEKFCESNKKVVQQGNGFKISETGIYLISAQATFWNFSVAEFDIKVENKSGVKMLAKCRTFGRISKENYFTPQSCSTTVFACLKQDDRVFVFSRFTEIHYNFDRNSAFIGFARLMKTNSCLLS